MTKHDPDQQIDKEQCDEQPEEDFVPFFMYGYSQCSFHPLLFGFWHTKVRHYRHSTKLIESNGC